MALSIYNTKEIDKNGFPIDEKGNHVPLFDGDGNAVLLLNSSLLVNLGENKGIVFNPKNKLDVSRALDDLVNILTCDFEKHIKGNITIDLTVEAKLKHRVYTKEPLKIPTVQMYFSWINGWLKYLGNCYNVEFKLLFYSKYKEQIKNSLIGLQTGINKATINKSYLKYAKLWLKDTDKNLYLEESARRKPKNKENFINENINQQTNAEKKIVRSKSKLSLSQIALIYNYKDESITRDNGKEIAKEYGFNSKYSGERLYQKFIKYFNPTDRKGDEGTKRKNQNKVQLIESIILLLPTENQARAKDEITILKNILDMSY